MEKQDYIKEAKKRLKGKSREIFLNQIETYYDLKENYKPRKHNYKIGDDVYLKKGTLLHGTYKNLEGLETIVKNGILSSWFIESKGTKYPSSVGLWNLQKDYYLKDYIDFYSGGTLEIKSEKNDYYETKVIAMSEMPTLIENLNKDQNCYSWSMQQTKEARFMPSLIQNKVQIGIIFNGDTEIMNGDILSLKINDNDVKPFVLESYYEAFLKERKNKTAFFTDRESAILFGVPATLIEGVLVGRDYEKDKDKLDKIKELFPNIYICNLDGKVIRE